MSFPAPSELSGLVHIEHFSEVGIERCGYPCEYLVRWIIHAALDATDVAAIKDVVGGKVLLRYGALPALTSQVGVAER